MTSAVATTAVMERTDGGGKTLPPDASGVRPGGGAIDLLLLSVRVRLHAADPADLAPLQAVFGGFRSARHSETDVDVRVERVRSARRVVSTTASGRRDIMVPDLDVALDCAYATIMDEVGRRSEDAVCFHAASLAHEGRGVVLVGPSRHGKTTLALALAARGRDLLSDEVAVVDRSSGSLHPFPLAVGCRSESLSLLESEGWVPPGAVLLRSRRKTWLAPSALTRPLPVGDVFVIARQAGTAEGRHATFRVRIDGPAAELVPEIARIEGLIDCSADADPCWLRMVVERGSWVADRVESVVAERGRVVLAVEDLDSRPADFGRPPEVERIGAGAGVAGLLRQLRGFGAVVAWTTDRPGGFADIFRCFATQLAGARFWRLRPGPLGDTVRQVERTVASPPSPTRPDQK